VDAFRLIYADENFYAPVNHSPRRGAEYRPASVPASWSQADQDVWIQWYPPHRLGGIEQGWKIHLSCPISRAQHVLDTAAEIFFAHGVAFKHLACAMFFVVTHHKHAARSQSGKFCVAYPPDSGSARALMTELAAALPGEQGPYVLSDRRFGDSQVVHYRYGAYVSRTRVRADGSHEMLVRDGDGRSVPDRRGLRFQLPDGITDPFAGGLPVPAAPRRAAAGRDSAGTDIASTDTASTRQAEAGSPSFAGYAFDLALQHSNGGGAYRARELSTGRPVFIKESRGYNGLVSPTSTSQDRLCREYATLADLHQASPGICPEPIAYFRRSENEFLVTELVPGVSLQKWCVASNPVIWPSASAADFRAYYRRCQQILDVLDRTLGRLHDLGYVFVDLNPSNVLVGADDSPRLIDFEIAAPAGELTTPVGSPGYLPKPELVGDEPERYDHYGLASLALSMIAPLNNTADRNPAVLAHLRHRLGSRQLVPGPLWARAVRFRADGALVPGPTPTPGDVEADPAGRLTDLRDRVVAGLLDSGHGDGTVPLGPRSYATNAVCAGHGLAGVLHALGVAGVPAPSLRDKLRRDSLREIGQLPPGLDVGLAGIAWVLADQGLLDEAGTLLTAADAHPVLAGSATLGHGRAGVGLAHLALFGHTGDESHLDRAAALADSIPRGDELTGQLGRDDATGLLSGRAGIALLHLYLARLTGQAGRLADGLRLLTAELDRATLSDGGLLFPASSRDGRLLPYLYCGTAGVGMVASRYLAATGDERLADTMPGLLAGVGSRFTHYGGLYAGMAGVGLFLHDHARRHQDGTALAQAWQAAKRMFLYAVPHGAGSFVMGEHDLRMSADLWYGSAGVLVFLSQLLGDRTDSLFTLDELTNERATATAAAR
jgi:hypothetical protein